MIAMIPVQMGDHLASKRANRMQQTEEQAGSKPHPVRAHNVHQRRLKESECKQRTLNWYSRHPTESAGGVPVMLEFWMEGPGQGRASFMNESHGVSCQWLPSVSSQEHVFAVKMCYCSQPVRRQGPSEDTMR